MRVWHKRLSVVLGVVLMLSIILSACSSALASAEREVVRWMVWGASEGWEQRVRILYELYPEYEEKYDIQIEVGGKADTEVAQKLRLALAANSEVPDIVQFNYSVMLGFASMGVFEDLTGFLGSDVDEFLESSLALVTYEDTIVGFPTALKPKLWYYRADLFEQAGIDPKAVRTEDDFIAAGKKLRETFPDKYIWNIGPSIAGYNLGMVISGNGGRFVDNDGNYIVASDPGVRKAFEFFKRCIDEGIVLDVSDFTPDWEKAYADEILVSTLNATWFSGAGYLPVYAPEQAGKWAVAQWPEVAGSVGGSDSGGSMSCIPAQSQHKEAAMDILKKITFDTEIRKRIYAIQPDTIPLTKAPLEDPVFKTPNSYYGESLIRERNIVLSGDAFKMFPYTPASALEFTLMNQYLTLYLSGEMTLDEALSAAENDLKNQIGNPYEYAK